MDNARGPDAVFARLDRCALRALSRPPSPTAPSPWPKDDGTGCRGRCWTAHSCEHPSVACGCRGTCRTAWPPTRPLALVMDGEWALSHTSAAAMCRLPLPAGAEPRSPLHVAVGPTTPVPQVAGVTGHEGLDADRVHRLDGGLPVVHPLRTWCDLVPRLPDTASVVLGDAVLRRWGDPEQLAAVVASRAGERGVVRMRRLLPLLRQQVDSPMETKTRLLLHRAGLPEPECGRAVHSPHDGGWVSTPDLSWPQVKVALEYDGEVHRAKARKWRHDIARKELMEDLGWRVLVATSDDVLVRPAILVARVASALRTRGLTW